MHKDRLQLYATNVERDPRKVITFGYQHLKGGKVISGLNNFAVKVNGFYAKEELDLYVHVLRNKQQEIKAGIGSLPEIKTEIPADLRRDRDVRKLTKQEMAQVMAALKGK